MNQLLEILDEKGDDVLQIEAERRSSRR